MADQSQDDKKGGAKKVPLSVRFAVFMLFVTALVFLPTTIVFTVCMIPTLVAAVVDAYPQKTAWLTIGAMNFAATLPVWFSLWDMGHTIPAAFQIVMQPTMIVIAYCGAAVGWAVYSHIPPLIAAMVLSKNERRLKDIERRQKELIKKWGEDVIT